MLLSGDIANMPMNPSAPDKEVEKFHGDLDEVVQSFVAISSKVYYIPGNVSLIIMTAVVIVIYFRMWAVN